MPVVTQNRFYGGQNAGIYVQAQGAGHDTPTRSMNKDVIVLREAQPYVEGNEIRRQSRVASSSARGRACC